MNSSDRSAPKRSLPAQPELYRLKKQAKLLLKRLRAGDEDAIAEVNAHYRDANLATFQLSDAQLVTARSYGFDSWPKLAAHVNSQRPIDSSIAPGFWSSLVAGDVDSVKTMLEENDKLVNHDFRPAEIQDPLTDGFPLVQACKDENLEMVRLLLDHGADVNARSPTEDQWEFGMPIIVAFGKGDGDYDIVDLLLDRGASVDAFPNAAAVLMDRVFRCASLEKGSEEIVAQLVRNSFGKQLANSESSTSVVDDGVSLDRAPQSVQLLARLLSMGGQPTLYELVRHQHVELIEDLIRKCPTAKTPKHEYPQGEMFASIAYGAAWAGYPDTLSMCMAAQPQLYTSDQAKSAIGSAIHSQNRDGEFADYRRLIVSQLEYLKERGDVTGPRSNGKPFLPLHHLAERFVKQKHYECKCLRLSTEEELIDLAGLFVEYGFDVNARHPKTNLTPLDIARTKQRLKYAKFLVEHGATEPADDKNVMRLAKQGDFRKLKAIWESGQRFDLATVFERAVTDFRTVKRNDGHLGILKFCIDEGLDPMTRADWMSQPLICTASMYGNAEIVEYIEQTVGLPNNEFVRASLGDVEYLKQCIIPHDVKTLARWRDKNQFNLLHYAVASGLGRASMERKSRQEATCRFLVDCGASTDLSVEKNIPLTPALLCAWYCGNPDIMEMLLEAGEIKIGELHQAVEFAFEPHQRSGPPFSEIAEVVLKHGFDINSIRPDQGRTLLHGSSNRGTDVAVEWLLENGADPNILDDQGRTALHVAAIRNTHTSVVEKLLRGGVKLDTRDSDEKTALDLARENGRSKVESFLGEWQDAMR